MLGGAYRPALGRVPLPRFAEHLSFCSKDTCVNAAAAGAWALPSCFRASGLCGESHAKSLCKAGSATASTSVHKSRELYLLCASNSNDGDALAFGLKHDGQCNASELSRACDDTTCDRRLMCSDAGQQKASFAAHSSGLLASVVKVKVELSKKEKLVAHQRSQPGPKSPWWTK